LPISHALHIASSALLALHHAHERTTPAGKPLGIVHRDVTPSNLMIAYEGSVKLLDFGVAKAAERLVESRAGTIKGKIAYLSPEQCKGNPIDRRSDVFSLGIVLHELLTTRRLYRRETDFATMNAIANEAAPPPSSLNADVGPELDAVVLRALAKDPDARYPTAAAMLNAVEVAAEHGRHVMSVSAMGRFMRELYGERPEPWVDLEQSEQESHAVTITSEAITVAGDVLASAGGVTAASPMTFPTLDTPVRNAIEEQLHNAPTIGVARSTGEQDEDASFEPADVAASPMGTKTVDQSAATAVETVTATAATIATDAPTIARAAEAPATPVRSRRALVGVAGGVLAASAIVVIATRSGGNAASNIERDAAIALHVVEPADAPPAPDAMTALPTPTIAAAVARGDWTGTLELCRVPKPATLSADQRLDCGRAACSAGNKPLALTFYPLVAAHDQAALVRVCRDHGVALVRTKDPCETDPLKCRKP